MRPPRIHHRGVGCEAGWLPCKKNLLGGIVDLLKLSAIAK